MAPEKPADFPPDADRDDEIKQVLPMIFDEEDEPEPPEPIELDSDDEFSYQPTPMDQAISNQLAQQVNAAQRAMARLHGNSTLAEILVVQAEVQRIYQELENFMTLQNPPTSLNAPMAEGVPQDIEAAQGAHNNEMEHNNNEAVHNEAAHNEAANNNDSETEGSEGSDQENGPSKSRSL